MVARLGLPSIVVTIGTMWLFRGIGYIVLGDRRIQVAPNLRRSGPGYVWWVFRFEALFAVRRRVYVLLHHTTSAASST